MATRAPSPPDEPPGVMYLLYGLVVRPKTWLYVSPHCERGQSGTGRASGRALTQRVCGTFVRTKGTAPCS